MATARTKAGERENDDVALIPFARAHLEGALKLSQEMSWPYRVEDWDFALQLGHGFVLQRAGVVREVHGASDHRPVWTVVMPPPSGPVAAGP